MRNLKKILALVLAMMMVLSMMVTANAAFVDADEIDGDYYEAVAVLSGLGVIDGVKNEDGTYDFNPKGILNRAQAAKIISYILTGDLDEVEAIADSVSNPFKDLPSWAEPYVLYAYNAGIVVGDGNGNYSPSRELTGYEFGKMLLIAAGICDNDDFADSWKTVVASNLKKAGLWNGKDFALSAKLTREQACEMAYAAMLYTEDEGTVWVVGDLVFTDLNTALLYCAITTAEDAPVEQPVNDGSLADTVFGLTPKYNAIDDSGRPYSYWLNGNGSLVAYIYDTPALVLNGPAYSTTLYTALGLRTGTTGNTVSGSNVYTNGVYGTDSDTVVIALNNYGIIGNYGVTTEIYTNAKGVPTSIAQIVYTYGYISAVTTGKETNGSTYTEYTITYGSSETVSGKVYTKALNKEQDSIDPAGAAKYDYVTFYKDASGFINVVPVSYVNGTLTKSSSSGVYTIDGAEYVVASGVNGATAPSVYNQARTYAIDQYGYILGDVTYVASTTSYLYVMGVEEINALVNNKIVSSVVADVIFSDGTTGTVTVDSATDAKGAEVTDLTSLGHGLYTYTVDKDGEYVLTGKTQKVTSISSTSPVIATDIVANANTKYIVANYVYSEKINDYVYAGTVNVLTGYANVPTAVSGTTLIASYTLNDEGIADVVFVESMTAANTTDVYAFYLGTKSYDGADYYYDVIVDAEYATVKNATFTTKGLYKLVGNTATAVTFDGTAKVQYKGGLLYVDDDYKAPVAADVTVYVINSNTGAVETLTAADLATAVFGDTLIVADLAGNITTLYIVK